MKPYGTATGPVTYDVNVGSADTYASFETKTSQSSNMSSETKNSWDVSAKISKKVFNAM